MEVGRSIPRVDAADKVTGRAKYTDDLCPRPVLEAKILHSTIANGWVKSMDISAAQALPGVVKVLTCFDVPDIQYPTPGHPWSVDPKHQDVSDRKLLNRFQALVQSVLWEELEEESMALQQHIQSYLSRLTTQIPVPVGYGEGDAVWPLLKTMKFQPVLDGVSPLERLTQYLELYHRLMPQPCVLLVGLHLYFSPQELEQFYQMALYEQWNLLVVEPYQSPPLSQERWHVIDGDFCELRVDSLGEIL